MWDVIINDQDGIISITGHNITSEELILHSTNYNFDDIFDSIYNNISNQIYDFTMNVKSTIYNCLLKNIPELYHLNLNDMTVYVDSMYTSHIEKLNFIDNINTVSMELRIPVFYNGESYSLSNNVRLQINDNDMVKIIDNFNHGNIDNEIKKISDKYECENTFYDNHKHSSLSNSRLLLTRTYIED